ncbi:MAG: hypothetical protein KatS3mg042_0670 [Rhodothermaceae bacterium]|nr:MAG: hypothetical protein KatS3mg042_0670 [Rhodothermaceae bacterium]
MTTIIIGWIITTALIWATLAGSAAVERYIHRRELEREANREGERPVEEARRIIEGEVRR